LYRRFQKEPFCERPLVTGGNQACAPRPRMRLLRDQAVTLRANLPVICLPLGVRGGYRINGALRSSTGFAPMCSTLPCHFRPR
jgi:hypothetical protein